jgi:hypothetical protein
VALVAVLISVAVSIVGDLNLVSRAGDLYLHSPAAHALDVLGDEERIDTDQAAVVQHTVLLHDACTLSIPDAWVDRSEIAFAARLTRSPPSA